jgi:hypothetical protein
MTMFNPPAMNGFFFSFDMMNPFLDVHLGMLTRAVRLMVFIPIPSGLYSFDALTIFLACIPRFYVWMISL